MVFPWDRRCSASYHLAVQAAHLCRPQHYNTVNAWAVPAFCQQHGITQRVIFSRIKLFQNFIAVPAFSIDLCGPKAMGV